MFLHVCVSSKRVVAAKCLILISFNPCFNNGVFRVWQSLSKLLHLSEIRPQKQHADFFFLSFVAKTFCCVKWRAANWEVHERIWRLNRRKPEEESEQTGRAETSWWRPDRWRRSRRVGSVTEKKKKKEKKVTLIETNLVQPDYRWWNYLATTAIKAQTENVNVDKYLRCRCSTQLHNNLKSEHRRPVQVNLK